MKFFKSVLLFIVLFLGLAYPLLLIHNFIFGEGGGCGLAAVPICNVVGLIFSYTFSVVFVTNLFVIKKRFLIIILFLIPVLLFFFGAAKIYWWFPISVILFAFALSELTKYLIRRHKRPRA